MQGTVLLYSSHDRCRRIHEDLIVRRALAGNRRVLFLTASTPDPMAQGGAWEGFRPLFARYRPHGLSATSIYWSEALRLQDVERLWRELQECEVVILGGGNSRIGLSRYKGIAEQHGSDRSEFGKVLLERQTRGLLTVGFSAGADQLSEYLFRRAWNRKVDTDGFGLARQLVVYLHHETAFNPRLVQAAVALEHCMPFGLPNDSGLLVAQGTLPSGNLWQEIEFIIDTTWDKPEDAWHIKTRAGDLIQHSYADGRIWSFRDGDRMIRLQSPDLSLDLAWIATNGQLYDYGTQQPSQQYSGIEQVLESY
jgi:hypothetical protein